MAMPMPPNGPADDLASAELLIDNPAAIGDRDDARDPQHAELWVDSDFGEAHAEGAGGIVACEAPTSLRPNRPSRATARESRLLGAVWGRSRTCGLRLQAAGAASGNACPVTVWRSRWSSAWLFARLCRGRSCWPVFCG